MSRFKQYIQYIQNAGSAATPDNFIDDWEPIGFMVLNDMKQDGLINLPIVASETITLTDKGLEVLGND